MLIAEDLLLLLLDDESGANQTTFMRPALGGALLVELALTGCAEIGERRRLRTPRVHVVPGAPAPEDPVLAAALGTLAQKPRTAQDLVNRLGKDLQPALSERLVERGILEHRASRVLGLFPRHRWPARDSLHEEQVRRTMAAALIGGQEPDERTAALIALLLAVDRVHRSIDRDGTPARDVKRRAKQIADGDWAAAGVRAAVQAAMAATMTAVTAGGAAGAASSG